MRKTNYVLIAFLLGQTILSSQGFADDQTGEASPESKISGYVNPMIGFAAPVNNAMGGPYFAYGGEAGVHTKLGDIGIFANSMSNSATVGSVVASANVTTIMLSLTSQVSYFYFGGRFGLGIRGVTATVSSSTFSASGSTFAVAPVVGARIPITSNISATVETSWQVLSSGEASGTLGTLTLNSAGYLIPLAGVRIGF